MRALLRTFLFILILLSALIAFALTPFGLRFGIAVTSAFLPGKLSIQKVSGVIIGPLTLNHLRYQNKTETITVEKLHFNWSVNKLFVHQFHINALHIEHLHITSESGSVPERWSTKAIQNIIQTTAHAFQQNTTQLPLSIDHAQITDILFRNLEQKTTLHIAEIKLHTALAKNKWDIDFSAAIKEPHIFNTLLQMNGTPNNYRVQLDITGDQTDWNLAGTGNQNSITFSTAKNKLFGGSFNAQLKINWQSGIQWHGTLQAQHVNASLLNPIWPDALSIHAKSEGDDSAQFKTTTTMHATTSNTTMDFTMTHNRVWHAQLRTHSSNAALRDMNFLLSGDLAKHDLSTTLRFKKQTIKMHLNGSWRDQAWKGVLDQLNIQTKTNFDWHLQNPVKIAATQQQLQITPLCLESKTADHLCLQGKWVGKQLAAELKININHFGWMRDFEKHIQIPSGHLTADFTATGNIAKPTISGKLNLHNGSMLFPRLNMALNNISASLESTGHILNFTAEASSKNKPLQIKGAVDLSHPDFNAQLTVTGKEINIVNTEEYSIDVTPNLNIVIKNKNVFLTGNIIVPRANIQPGDYQPIITLPTHDIVYTGEVIPPPQPFWITHIDVTVRLGNQIHVKAAGFDANLTGQVHIVQKQSGELFGTGQIHLHNGIYNIYGQKLTVSNDSYLDYTDSLLDNPSLNLNASRTIRSINRFSGGDFTAGIALRGTIRTPKISFFSDRGRLSQADILSYILLGYDTSSSNTGGNTDLLLRAVSAVNITSQGLLGKQNIATQIQSGLGLSELGVESETTVDALGNPLDRQSAFVVGKNITRRLYMRYSIGLLTPVNVFEVGYLLNKNWAVQSDSSSLGNGADVLYTISR